jgi:hypothetical protein
MSLNIRSSLERRTAPRERPGYHGEPLGPTEDRGMPPL